MMPSIAYRRAFAAALLVVGLLSARAPGAKGQGAAPVERRSQGAAEIDRIVFPPLTWTPPAIGKEVERRTLGNGIVLYLYPDHTLPIVELVGLMRAGRLYEPAEKAGLTQMAASQIRAGGTTSLTADALNEELESLAAHLEFSAGEEALEFRLNLLSHHADRGLQLLADILLRPAFDPAQLDLARGRALEDLRRRRDNPTELLLKEFAALHYTSQHPLGREPTEVTIRDISRDDLIAFHRRYVRPDNLLLGVAGDFDKAALVERLEQLLGGWSATGNFSLPPIPPVNASGKPGVYLVDKPGPQSAIAIGHFAVDRAHPDRHALELMNQLLGGAGFTSRLSRRVRSAEGLAYSVGSRFATEGRVPGLFRVITFTRTDAAHRAIAAARAEIRRLTTESATDQEFATVTEALANAFLFRFIDPAETVRHLMTLELHELPADYYQTLLDRYRAITPDRVRDVARRHIAPEDLAIVVVGDAKILQPALAAFGPITYIRNGPPSSRAP